MLNELRNRVGTSHNTILLNRPNMRTVHTNDLNHGHYLPIGNNSIYES
jgi:hypothetical protein